MDTMKLTGLHSLQINCPDGKFGYKCRYMCVCSFNIACDKITGLCISGLCKIGYWGPGCQLDDKCFYNQQPKKYMGMLSSTKSNLECQHWNTNYPHNQPYTVSEFFDRRLPNNYCRSIPDEDEPWCYTTSSKVRWEYCPVESCACPLGRYDIYCNKDCHCKNSNEHCDEVTGECKSGCAMGWTGGDCQTVIPCEPNKYGWECEKNCYCKNPSHCERFLGATSHCVLSTPMIVHFENKLVLPGQASTFTCTVQANPPPKDDEIQMFGPQGKNIISLSSRILESSTLRRTKMFYVTSVDENEQYTCSAQSELGSNNLTLVADLLGAPPKCPTEISVSRIDDLMIISWKPKQNTEINQHFEVLVFKSTGNLTPVNAREGTVIAVIQNSTAGTLEYRYNTSGQSSSDPLVFTIIASNDYGKVECNTTINDGVATDCPYNLKVLQRFNNSLTLSWKQGFNGDPPETFSVTYQDLTTNISRLAVDSTVQVPRVKQTTSRAIEYSLSGLLTKTPYKILINATINNGETACTPLILIAETTGPPECPVNITILKVAKDHISLSWKPGQENELPQTYNILAHNVSVFRNLFLEFVSVGRVHTKNYTLVMYTIGILSELKQYTFSVEVENIFGITKCTDKFIQVTTTSGPPECPVNITILKVAKDHVSLSWKPGQENELPQTYTILAHYVSAVKNIFLKVETIGRVHTRNYTLVMYTVGNLSELTQYTFSVEVENNFGITICTDNFIQVTTSSGLQKLSFPSCLIFLLIFIPIVLAAGIPGFIFYKRKANRSKALHMNTFSASIEKSDHHSVYHTAKEAAVATIRDTDDERDHDLIIEEQDLEDFKSSQFEREGIRPRLPPRSSETKKLGTICSGVSQYDVCGAHEFDQPGMKIAYSTSQNSTSFREEDNNIIENDFVHLSEDKGINNSLHKPFRNQNNNQESAGINRYSKTFIEFKIKGNENSSTLIAQKEHQYSGHDMEFKTEDEESVKTLKVTDGYTHDSHSKDASQDLDDKTVDHSTKTLKEMIMSQESDKDFDAYTHDPHSDDTRQEIESKIVDHSTKTLKENNTSQASDKDIGCMINENSKLLKLDLADTEACQACYSLPLIRTDVHFYSSLSCVESRSILTLNENELKACDEQRKEHTNYLKDKPNVSCPLKMEIDKIQKSRESYVDLTDQAYNADNSSYIPSMLSNFVNKKCFAMRDDDSNKSKDDAVLKCSANGLAGDIILSNSTKVEDNEYIKPLDFETYPPIFGGDEIATEPECINNENWYLQFDGAQCEDDIQMKHGSENKEEYMTWDGGDVSCDEDVPNNNKPDFASSSREVALDANSRKGEPAANQSKMQEDVFVYWTPDGTKKRAFGVANELLCAEYSAPYDYLKN